MLRSLFVLFTCCVVLCVGYGYGGPPTSCGANEELRCVQPCPPEKTCLNRDILFSCLAVIQPCETKCVCKEGYFKNPLGTCITGEQCDQCSRHHEFFACDSACDNECSKINEQNRTNCPIRNIVCNPQCYCDDGYARDDKRNCIPQDKCSGPPTSCGANQELRCVQPCPPEKTCRNRNFQISCLAVIQPCETKCVCKEGYFKTPLGTCITGEQCDSVQKCGENEQFTKCKK